MKTGWMMAATTSESKSVLPAVVKLDDRCLVVYCIAIYYEGNFTVISDDYSDGHYATMVGG